MADDNATGGRTQRGQAQNAGKRLPKVKLAPGEAKVINALRQALIKNGYVPTPARDKRTLFKGWNSLLPDADVALGWLNGRAGVTPYPATGLLIDLDLVTIDSDVPDAALSQAIRLMLSRMAPHLFEAPSPALERGRDDNSPKFMLFCRRVRHREGEPGGSKPFTIKSKKWSMDPADEGLPTFQIEIFGSDRNAEGKVIRQVGAFGPHTVDDETGEVRIRYTWRGPSPAQVPLANLAVIDAATALKIAGCADELFAAAGMKELPGYRGGLINPMDAYDLTDDMKFDGADFADVGLEELKETYWANEALGLPTRCSGSFTGEGGTRKDRCQVGWSGSTETGHITIHDHATETTHRPATEKPSSPDEAMKLLRDIARLTGTAPEAKPDNKDPGPRLSLDDDGKPRPAPTWEDRLTAALGEAVTGALTEHGIARALQGLYGDKLCYVPVEKQWLRFEAPRWVNETVARIETLIVGRFCQALPMPNTPAGRKARVKLEAQRHYSAIEKLMRGLMQYTDGFDRDPYMAAGPLLAVNLRTGEQRAGKPHDRLRMSWAYDPASAASQERAGENCPLWKNFLVQITLGDGELQLFLQQWMGLSLCGDPTHQKLSFFHGTGRNGKSVFIDVMKKIVGDYGYKAPIEVFMDSKYERHSTDKWMLKGKRLITASEIKKGSSWDENLIKALTGDAEITARAMRENNVTFSITGTITIIGNNEPDLKDLDPAIKARLLLVPFLLELPEAQRDEQLMKKLLEEAPGILRWAINGLIDVRKNGLIKPLAVRQKTEAYFSDQDIRQGFVDEYITVDPAGEVDNVALFRRWESYVKMRNGRVGGLNGLGWITDLTGAVKHKKNTGIVWNGIILTSRGSAGIFGDY